MSRQLESFIPALKKLVQNRVIQEDACLHDFVPALLDDTTLAYVV
jgi:hypothetical protein